MVDSHTQMLLLQSLTSMGLELLLVMVALRSSAVPVQATERRWPAMGPLTHAKASFNHCCPF